MVKTDIHCENCGRHDKNGKYETPNLISFKLMHSLFPIMPTWCQLCSQGSWKYYFKKNLVLESILDNVWEYGNVWGNKMPPREKYDWFIVNKHDLYSK